MISTGTDIKPVECLLFMRLVKSRVLFEQMVGRGTRVIDTNDLLAVTPDAPGKDHFVIVDAVGIVEHPKVDLELQPEDLDYGEFFNRGGRIGAMQVLGPQWMALVEEMNAELAVA